MVVARTVRLLCHKCLRRESRAQQGMHGAEPETYGQRRELRCLHRTLFACMAITDKNIARRNPKSDGSRDVLRPISRIERISHTAPRPHGSDQQHQNRIMRCSADRATTVLCRNLHVRYHVSGVFTAHSQRIQNLPPGGPPPCPLAPSPQLSAGGLLAWHTHTQSHVTVSLSYVPWFPHSHREQVTASGGEREGGVSPGCSPLGRLCGYD
jgi:hypothetical protein